MLMFGIVMIMILKLKLILKDIAIDCFVSFSALNGESVSCAYMSLSYKAANLRFPNGIYAEIYGVYTRPEYRNKYLASQNIAILIEQGKKMDVSFVELDASSDGFGVYKRIGFVPADTNYKKMKYYYK